MDVLVGGRTGTIVTRDKVFYTPKEQAILKEIGGITKDIHLAKKVFEGEIIGNKKRNNK